MVERLLASPRNRVKVLVQFGRDLDEQTTTGGLPYIPFPLAGPVILKPASTVDADDVKKHEACKRAMLDYIHGHAKKSDVDRICGGK